MGDLDHRTDEYGRGYRAPEIVDWMMGLGNREKVDVFASAFILLAIYAGFSFSSGSEE
jgi:hypothetical protein